MKDQVKHDGAAAQETDLWWGAYNGMTLLPSLAMCIVLTGAIVWGAWALVERRHLQWTIWSFSAAVWLVQVWRWSWRVFGINYRVTTRRLLIDLGHVWSRHWAIELASVRGVDVKHNGLRVLANIGQVIVHCDNGESIVLEGVSAPEDVAKMIREQVQHGKKDGQECPSSGW